jgi:hypothetical protein
VSAHSLSHNHSLIAPSNPTAYSLTPSLRLVSGKSHTSLHSTYEVVGKVLTLDGGMGLGLRVLGATEWPKNADTEAVIDLKAYEAVVDATHRYKGISTRTRVPGSGRISMVGRVTIVRVRFIELQLKERWSMKS